MPRPRKSPSAPSPSPGTASPDQPGQPGQPVNTTSKFENWAVIALGSIPNVTKTGDRGIDGRIYPVSAAPKKRDDMLDFMNEWYPIQVKQKDKTGRPDIDAFQAMMMRENRPKGFFISFDYTTDALAEIQGFFTRTGKVIIPLTVREILDEQITMKLV